MAGVKDGDHDGSLVQSQSIVREVVVRDVPRNGLRLPLWAGDV
jgi:hypothetical protein